MINNEQQPILNELDRDPRPPLPSPRLKIISSRVVCRNGRPVREYIVDASRELGRGRSYVLTCGL